MFLQKRVLEPDSAPNFKFQALVAQVVILNRKYDLFLLGKVNSGRNLLDLPKRRSVLFLQIMILLLNLSQVCRSIVV